MEKIKNKVFGLLGKNIEYSFSRGYFTEKFKKLDLEKYQYVNFDIEKIEDFQEVIAKGKGNLGGMNVTIPYKQDVLNYLDTLD